MRIIKYCINEDIYTMNGKLIKTTTDNKQQQEQEQEHDEQLEDAA